jgi:urea transport system substrate-binding protein
MLPRTVRASLLFLLSFCCGSCATTPRFAPPPPAAPIVLEPEQAPEPEQKAEPAPSETTTGRASEALAPVETDRVRVGIIHSLSGTMAHEETPLMNAALMAIDQLNRAGGVLGKKLEPVIVDPASNWPLFAEKARELLQNERTSVVFGGYTSVSRKSMLPVFEEHQGLCFYPAQHEGEETWGSVFYTGSIPNQSVSVVADYLAHRKGAAITRWFVIGTDYIVPRVQAKILMDAWRAAGVPEQHVEIVFAPFGHSDFKELVGRVRKHAASGPTAVLSLLFRESAVEFQRELVLQRVSPKVTPVFSFGIDERDAEKEGALFSGTFLARAYFGSVDGPRNAAFKQLCADYAAGHDLGAQQFTLNDDVEATYIGVHLWKQAVESAKTFDRDAVVAALANQTFDAPSGFTVRVDPKNHHLHKPYFVAQVGTTGKAKVVWKTPAPLPPVAPSVAGKAAPAPHFAF